jgi:hypothetical protein
MNIIQSLLSFYVITIGLTLTYVHFNSKTFLIGWIYFLESFSLFYFIIPVPLFYIYLTTGTGMHVVSSVLALYYFGYCETNK